MDGDRELLELAAKAAAMFGWRYAGPSGLHKMIDPSQPETTGSIGPAWNPLTDDGDALRLAVKLGLRIGSSSFTQIFVDKGSSVFVSEGYGVDPLPATRRAIVRAAAKIARQMP